MADLPTINSLLHVVVDDEVSFQSRLLDIEERRLTIAAPVGKGDLEIPRDGSELEVFWTGNRTRFMLGARMHGWTRELPPRWYLLAVRDPTRRTRRRFVRGGGGGAIGLMLPDDAGCGPFRGWTIDISEAGVRCRMQGLPDELVSGRPVVVTLAIGDRTLEVKGTILLVRPAEGGTDLDVIVTYDPPECDARVIRQHVLQWEITRRRLECGYGNRAVTV